jgi:hypothetical protein
MSAVSLLLRPFDYLRIRHDAKNLFDWWIPIALAIATVAIVAVLPQRISLLGNPGLVSGFSGLLQVLTGFYIAALAALATFNKDDMDKLMSGDPPRLLTTVRGEDKEIRLTRRRFLCLMFGYLSLLSLLLYMIGLGAQLFGNNVAALVRSEDIRTAFYYSALFFYSLVMFNMVITTLVGLYYMADRMHRPDSGVISGEPGERDDEST